MAYVSDISDYELFTEYSIQEDRSDSGRYKVLLRKLGDPDVIAIIEKISGQWKIHGDQRDEYPNLYKAIRFSINSFLKTKAEYRDVLDEFQAIREKPIEDLSVPKETHEETMTRLRKEFNIER